MGQNSLTILIPTYNRPELLKGALRFLLPLPENMRVIILDGSSEENKVRNQKVVQDLQVDQIVKRDYPAELDLCLRLRDGILRAETEYTLIWPDDDFLVTSTVERCIDLLRKHPDYSSAQGRFLCVVKVPKARLFFGRAGFALVDALKYHPSIHDDQILRRIIKQMKIAEIGGLPNYYSVRRTKQLQDIYTHLSGEFKWTDMEILNIALGLVQGKLGTIDDLFAIRNYSVSSVTGPNREGSQTYFSTKGLSVIKAVYVDWLTNAESVSREVAEYSFDQIADIRCLPNTKDRQDFSTGEDLSQHPQLNKLMQVCANVLFPRMTAWWFHTPPKILKKLRACL